MDTESALLAAVLANPDDDLPRLVYADWLEENGQAERAEFIRTSVAESYGGQYTSITSMVRQYRPHVHVGDRWPEMTLCIRRGFIAEVYCTLADWCGGLCGCFTNEPDDGCAACGGTGHATGIGPAVVRSHPVTSVHLTDHEPASYRVSTDTRAEEVAAVLRFWPDMAGVDRVWTFTDHDEFQSQSRRYGFTQPVRDFPSHISGEIMRHYERRPRPTREAALDALSDALIRWARCQAVSPPA